MNNIKSRLTGLCLFAITLTLSVGCSSHKQTVLSEANNPSNVFIKETPVITAEYIRNHMTPELRTTALTQEQRLNRRARTLNLLKRQFWADLDKCLLLDQINHNSEYIIP